MHKTSLKNIKARGFYFRNRLKNRIDKDKKYLYTEELLNYIGSYKQIEFLTVCNYAKKYYNL